MAIESPPLPDQSRWTRYSPNQEFSLSGLASLALHVAAAAILVLLFQFIIARPIESGMPVEAFSIDGEVNSGGGGDPGGNITDGANQPRVERANASELPPDLRAVNAVMGPLPDVKEEVLPDLPVVDNSDRIFEQGNAAKSKLDAAGKAPPTPRGSDKASGGRAGPGQGGGEGAGSGVGKGSGTAPGTQGSVRQRRNRRWTLTFDTQNGNDYVRQLSLLGVTLVADWGDGNRSMYRKLDTHPVPAETIDEAITKRQMSWHDERPTFVRELTDAMGLTRMPISFKAYFPFRFEEELLQKELAYRGRKEGEIHSTVFRVISEGSGVRVVVTEQRLN